MMHEQRTTAHDPENAGAASSQSLTRELASTGSGPSVDRPPHKEDLTPSTSPEKDFRPPGEQPAEEHTHSPEGGLIRRGGFTWVPSRNCDGLLLGGLPSLSI